MIRRIAGPAAALGAAVVLAACGQPEAGKPAGPSPAPSRAPASGQAAPAASTGYDIARVGDVKGDFPAGFNPEARPAKTLSQQDIDGSGVAVFTKAPVNPPQCRPLIIPPYAEPSVGTQAAGVQGQGDQGRIYVVALRLPQPVPATAAPAGCDRVSLSGSPQAAGTAERIGGPAIDGVTTTGVRLSPVDAEDPDYIFTAALDDQTTVVVMGSADKQLDPPQLLSGLLVKATCAVRGR